MSKTIDEKVVSMQFDNKHFESNVKTTMSTLDRLKQSLNLTGASKGLENVNAAAGKVNMSGLASGVESVRMKFSALEVMGVTALANITNSAVNAGKNIVSALTIEPISDGFSEYEMTLNAVQTTMAATNKSAKEVEVELKKLDDYADKTVYSTADMLNNLPKFTNAGVDLEKATTAMIGIANATALAGGGASQASIAFYNLGQAIGTGYLTRMDYNSINNAGIATMKWKEEMVKAAIAQKTLTKVGEDAYEAGGKTFTLQQLFIDGLQEQWATTDVMMEVFGKYGNALDKDVGEKAYAAAQDIKTFSQMMESLKATAGTGWKDTWQTVFGGLDKAKEFWTGLSNAISSIIEGMADWRNGLLEKALGSPFAGISDKIQSILNPVEKVTSAVENTISTIENLDEIANKVIRGDYKNTDTGRRQNLMAEGYNWAVVQNRVNEILGCTVRHSEEAAEAELKLYQAEHGLVEKGDELTKTQDKSNESRATTIDQLVAMSDAELEALGLTKDEIQALRDLKKICDQTGVSMEDALGDPDKLSGRTLLINSLKNAASGLVGIFKAMGEAWRRVFYGDASDEEILNKQAQGLYGIIAAIHKFSACLRLTDSETGDLNDNGKKLQRTFAGLFAVLDLITDILGGAFKLAFKVVSAVLGYFGLNILDVTAAVGDALVKFRDWVKKIFDVNEIVTICIDSIKVVVGWIKDWVTSNESLNSALETLKSFLSPVVKHIKNLFNALKGAESFADVIKIVRDWVMNLVTAIGTWASSNDKLSGTFGKIVSYIQPVISAIQAWVAGLKETDNVPKYIIEGLVNGIKVGIPKAIEAILSLGAKLIAGFCEVLGIHSPSTVFIALGAFILAGLIGGITGGAEKVFNAIKDIASGIKESFEEVDTKEFFEGIGDFFKGLFGNIGEILGNIDWGSLIALGLTVGLVVGVSKIAKTLEKLGEPLTKFSDVMDSVKGAFDELGGYFKAAAWEKKTEGIKNLAIAIAIMAGAIFLLASVDPVKLIAPVLAIAALAGVMYLLAMAVEKMSDIDVDIKEGKFSGINTALLGLSASLLLMAVTVKLIAGMGPEEMAKAALGLVAFLVVIGGVFLAYGKLGKGGANLDKVGTMLVKIAGAMLVLVLVAKLIASMEPDEMLKGAGGLLVLSGIIALLMKISKIGNAKKIGTMLIGIAGAMLVLVLVAKLIAGMEPDEMIKGGIGLLALSGIIALLMKISKMANSKKIGTMLLGIAGAMAILAITAKIIAKMEPDEMLKGGIGLLALSGIIAILVSIVKIAGNNAPKIAATLLALSASIGILAIVAIMLGWVDLGKLAKGVIAVGILSVFMAGMVAALDGAQNVTGSLIAMTVAIAVMAGAVAALSLIDTGKLITSTLCMSLLMGMFAVIENFSTTVTSSMKSLIAMSIAIAVIGGIMFLLGQLEPQNAIASAVALSVLLLAMTGVTVILSKISTNIKNALLGVLSLTLMAVPLLALVGVLALMSGVKNAMVNATALAALASVLTVLLIPLCAIGMLITATMGLCLLGIAGLLLMAVPLVAFVGILALMNGIENATTNTNLLIGLAVVLAGLLTQLSIIAPMALMGVTALAALVGLIVALGALATGVGALMTKFPALKDFMSVGLPLLEQLALSLGTMIGNFIAGFASGIAASLPYIGAQLSAFMVAVLPFIMGAKMIDSSVLVGVGVLAASILALTVADLINGMISFVTGGASFARLGEDLSTFIVNAMPFIEGIKMVDAASAESAKALANMILALTAANLLDQITSFLGGEGTLESFAQQIIPFGEAMVQFSQTVAGNIDEEAVTAAANAGKIMADMAATLPNSGGVLGFFAGENDMDTFGQQLVVFGDSIVKFSETVAGKIDQEAVEAAANAGATMVELAETIPNTGGLVGFLCGDNDFATFGTQLVVFGESMVNYANTVDGLNTDAITTSVTAASKLSELQNSIGKTGGLVALFTGDSGLDTFGEKLVEFGEAMDDYSNEVDSISSFQLSATTTQFGRLIEMSKSAENVDFEGINAFGEALEALGESGVEDFVDAFEEGESDVKDAGKDLINSAIKGIEAKDSAFKKAAKEVAEKGADGVSDKKSSFKSAGKDLGDGLVEGIEAKEDAAYDAGYALGQAAVQGEKDGQQSKSPSKLTIKAGHWLGEGLIVGMKQMGTKVYSAGSRLGESATSTISNTISRIGDAVNGNIDTQPTIRPVLDLSDVSAGAGAISDMFNTNPSVGVLSNIRSINTMMNKRQNGNSEIISALKDLKDTVGNNPSNTYSINGINVNEGTDVADAIKVITRAAIRERRV